MKGSPMSTRHAFAPTRLGDLTLAATADRITGVYFPGHWHAPTAAALGERVALEEDPVLAALAGELEEFFAGDRVRFTGPAAPAGGPFETAVWRLLEEIPYGTTVTYGHLAARMGGGAGLARRVGQAVGRNPISVVIPCHRVVGSTGALTGYAGGLERKRFLLALEREHEPSETMLF